MYLTRAGKRQLIAAVSVITAISCLLSLASIKGITADLPENEKYCHMSFELYPNGEQAEQFVSLDGLMPEGAVAQAVDVSDDYSGAAAYDITISTGMEEYQPGEENPVLVAITDPVITAGSAFMQQASVFMRSFTTMMSYLYQEIMAGRS